MERDAEEDKLIFDQMYPSGQDMLGEATEPSVKTEQPEEVFATDLLVQAMEEVEEWGCSGVWGEVGCDRRGCGCACECTLGPRCDRQGGQPDAAGWWRGASRPMQNGCACMKW